MGANTQVCPYGEWFQSTTTNEYIFVTTQVKKNEEMMEMEK